jgi:hypothetical protein
MIKLFDFLGFTVDYLLVVFEKFVLRLCLLLELSLEIETLLLLFFKLVGKMFQLTGVFIDSLLVFDFSLNQSLFLLHQIRVENLDFLSVLFQFQISIPKFVFKMFLSLLKLLVFGVESIEFILEFL